MQIKAIIVDDSRLEIEMLLESIDWNSLSISICGTALNGKKGIELFEREHPDLIITDIQMPVMDGIEMTEKIRQFNQDVCIVFLSSYKEFEYAHAGYALGVKEYILKQDIDSRNTVQIFLKLKSEISKKKDLERRKKLEHFFSDPRLELPIQLKDSCCYQLAVLFYDEKLPFSEKYCSSEKQIFQTGYTFYDRLLPIIESFPVICLPETDHSVLLFWKMSDTNEINLHKEIGIQGRNLLEQIQQQLHLSSRLLVLEGYGDLKMQKEHYFKLQPSFKARWFLPSNILMEISESGIYQWEAVKKKNEPLPMPPERIDIEQLTKWVEQGCANQCLKQIAAQITASQDILEAKNLVQLLDVYCNNLWDYCQKNGYVPESLFENKLSADYTFQDTVYWLSSQILYAWNFIHSCSNKQYSPSVEMAIKYMKQHLNDKQLDINQTAEFVSLSPSHFRFKFKSETGFSPNHYLSDLRFARAEKLLLTTCMKLEDIADEVGFLDGKYFRKTFHKKYGMTPREFREQRGKKDEKK